MFGTEGLRSADGCDHDVGTLGHCGKILGSGMGDRNGGVTPLALCHEQEGHRLADDKAAADDNDLCARGLDTGGNQESLATERGAGNEGRGILHGELGHIDGMKSVDILARVDGEGDRVLVDVLRGRGLDEDTVDGGIGVEFGHEFQDLVLSGGGGKLELARMHPEGRAGTVLVADVGLGGGILTDEHHGQTGGDAPCLEGFNACEGFVLDLGGDRLSVNECHKGNDAQG